jgi:lycopene cyclase CruA
VSWLLRGWFPGFIRRLQPWIENRYPALWLRLLAVNYAITTGMGRPEKVKSRDVINSVSTTDELIPNSTQGEVFEPK